MKVLMFGWEYPPHVFGGLATANYCPNLLAMKTARHATLWP